MSPQPSSISPLDPRLDIEPQAEGCEPGDPLIAPGHLFPRVVELGSAEEDWTGVTEQAKRRRLQNRLNQRARRKKQRHVHGTAPTGALDDPAQVHQTSVLGDIHPETLPRCRLARPEVRAQMQAFAERAVVSYQRRTLDTVDLADTLRANVFLALLRNTQILGFDDCCTDDDAVSPFNKQGPLLSSPNCPATLRPTPLQVSVEHHPWIDLFPCPRMRDNFLRAVLLHGEDSFDEYDLCHDMVDVGGGTGDATIIAWTDTWSPSGWEVTALFLRKWGWLLYGCVEMQAGTNAWRQRRGLGRLRFPGC